MECPQDATTCVRTSPLWKPIILTEGNILPSTTYSRALLLLFLGSVLGCRHSQPKPVAKKVRPVTSPNKAIAIYRMERALGRFELQRMELRKVASAVSGYPQEARQAWSQLFASLRPLLPKVSAYRLKLLERKLQQEKKKDLRDYKGFPLELEKMIDEFMADNKRQQHSSRLAALRAFRRAMGAQASAQKAMQSAQEHLTSAEPQDPQVRHRSLRLLYPLPGHDITSGFGWRKGPFTKRRKFHGAIDIGAPKGTPIHAAASGAVIFAGWMGGCGKAVFVRHQHPSYRKVVTGYCHLSRIRVRKGQALRRGQVLGLVGSTGRSTAPHLHFVLRISGRPVNPSQNLVIDS